MNPVSKTIDPGTIDPRRLYSVDAALLLLGISRTTLHWLRKSGQIESVRWLRRGVRIRGSALLRFIARCQSTRKLDADNVKDEDELSLCRPASPAE